MDNKLIIVTSDSLGQGNKELGEVLMENFFTVLRQNESLPKVIFFLNSGVRLLSENHLVSTQLEELKKLGVKLLACKTCVDFYQLANEMKIGELSNIKQLITLSSQMETITIG